VRYLQDFGKHLDDCTRDTYDGMWCEMSMLMKNAVVCRTW